jgi:hypothetical protein
VYQNSAVIIYSTAQIPCQGSRRYTVKDRSYQGQPGLL